MRELNPLAPCCSLLPACFVCPAAPRTSRLPPVFQAFFCLVRAAPLARCHDGSLHRIASLPLSHLTPACIVSWVGWRWGPARRPSPSHLHTNRVRPSAADGSETCLASSCPSKALASLLFNPTTTTVE